VIGRISQDVVALGPLVVKDQIFGEVDAEKGHAFLVSFGLFLQFFLRFSKKKKSFGCNLNFIGKRFPLANRTCDPS
jgi:hypothetical protein